MSSHPENNICSKCRSTYSGTKCQTCGFGKKIFCPAEIKYISIDQCPKDTCGLRRFIGVDKCKFE